MVGKDESMFVNIPEGLRDGLRGGVWRVHQECDLDRRCECLGLLECRQR